MANETSLDECPSVASSRVPRVPFVYETAKKGDPAGGNSIDAICDVHTAPLTAAASTWREMCCRETGPRISAEPFSAGSYDLGTLRRTAAYVATLLQVKADPRRRPKARFSLQGAP